MTFDEELKQKLSAATLNSYTVDGTGVKQQSGDSAKAVTLTPMVPTATYRNVDSGIEKVELSYYVHGSWESAILDRQTLASNSKIVALADRGIDVTTDTARPLVKYINGVVSTSPFMPYKESKSTMGWHGNKFVPYCNIVCDCDDQAKRIVEAVHSQGTLEEWVEFFGARRSNMILRLALDASFASVLIEKLGELPFIWQVWGGTGTGKSVTLLVAMSVWGNPDFGKLSRSLNCTLNSMVEMAALLKNIPFAGDELQSIKNRWQGNFDDLVMNLTEGVSRGRLGADGKVTSTKSWACSFLMTGEEPCVKFDSGGGAKNRVILMECTDKIVTDGNRVANFAKSHYGNAGRVFVENVSNRELSEQYREKFAAITSQCDTTDKQAGAMSLLMLADDIVNELFWKDAKPLTVDDIKQYLCTASEVDVTERAWLYCVDAIARRHVYFTEDGKEIWGRDCEDGTILVNRTILERDILGAQGFDFDACKKKWIDSGHIELWPNGRVAEHHSCYGAKASYVRLAVGEKQTTLKGSNAGKRIESDPLPF